MKSFTTLFDTEKNQKTGASPVWILKIPFVAGTVYLSDRVFAYAGITIKPWVSEWGGVDEDISDEMGAPQVSDFSLDLIIDPDEATDIHDLLWSEAVETLDCELYLWFEGLDIATDPMVLMWSGNIIDFERRNELLYSLRLADESVRIDKHPGRVLSLADYPYASLDDVGYQMPIVYGAVDKVPALRLNVGAKTSLISAITAAATDFYLTSGTGLVDTDHILIDAEEIHITTIVGNHITACTRGVGTTATIHAKGALVLEKQAVCVFMFADHPVKAIDNIYALRTDGVPVDVTSLCTKYTGQGGANDLAGYAGKAVITCPGYITFEQAVALGITDTIAVATDEGSHAHTASLLTYVWEFDTYTILHGAPTSPERVVDGMLSPCATLVGGTSWDEIRVSRSMYVDPGGTPYQYRVCIRIGNITNTIQVHIVSIGTGLSPSGTSDNTTIKGSWAACPASFDTWAEVNTQAIDLDCSSTGAGYYAEVGEVWMEFTYYPAAAAAAADGVLATKSGTVALSGASYPNTAVGDKLLISGDGYQDDGSGTFTGVASALIERPDHIFKHFLFTYAAWPTVDFSTDAGMRFAADSYAFSVVMNTRKRMKEWLAYMALQCRCWFRFASGKACLLYRPDTLVSDKTIEASMIRMNSDYTTSVRISRSPLDEIINKISLYYSRDWTITGREAYQAIVTVTDATSIAAYGEKEKPDMFLFDFITNATMAADVAAFYLARYKDRKKKIALDLFLDNSEIEFADALMITPVGSLPCEVRKVNFQPGSGVGKKNDLIMIEMKEY